MANSNKNIILLDAAKIKSSIEEDIEIIIFNEIDSTNDHLKQFFLQDNKTRVCLAEMQTKGRGQFDKKWHSPLGQNIYFSLLYSINKPLHELAGLSLVIGLAICKTLENLFNIEGIEIKWPNDILYKHQKLAGILIENKPYKKGITQVIIGIGININMESATDEEITQSWTSLHQIMGANQDRNKIVAHLIQHLLAYLDKFTQQGFTSLQEEWQTHDTLFDKEIKLKLYDTIFTGIGAGINEQGQLIVKLDKGQLKAFTSGEATLVK